MKNIEKEVGESAEVKSDTQYLSPSDLIKSKDIRAYTEFSNFGNFGNGPTDPGYVLN